METVKTVLRKLTGILCFVFLVMTAAGCANLQVAGTGRQQQIQEKTALLREYEDRKEFKKALRTMKELGELEPDNQNLRDSIRRLEEGLQEAVRRHLILGKYYIQKGNPRKAEKEFLLAFFLDPENREVLGYLRRLSSVSFRPAPLKKTAETPQALKGKRYILHTLKPGESLSILARRYYGDKMKYGIIAEFNNIRDVNNVSVGQQIMIPVPEKPEPLKVKKKEKTPVPPPEKTEPEQPETLTEEVQPEPVEKPEKQAVEEAESLKLARLEEKTLEDIFNKGEKLFNEEKFSEAIAEFQKVLQKNPGHKDASERMKTAREILSFLKKGEEFYMERKYGRAYDEFSRILVLKPGSAVANKKIDRLISPMITEAAYLLHDEQSPCESMSLTRKVLQRVPGNKDARDLLEEATILQEGLEIQCNIH